MKILIKIVPTVLILYTLAGKFYTTVFNFKLHDVNLVNGLFIHFTDIIMLLMLFVALLIVWEKWNEKINYVIYKFRYLYKLLITLIVVIQSFLSLLDYFNKNPNVNQHNVLFIGDLPNLFSIIIAVILIITLPNKKNIT